MKRLTACLMAVVICMAVSYADFDYTISDTYDYGMNLENESLLVTGAGSLQIDAKGESYIEVQNTATPLQQGAAGIYTLGLDDTSTMNFYNGALGDFLIYNNAQAVFSGGSIGSIGSWQHSDVLKHITFICDVDSVDLTGNILTGDWLDDKGSFEIMLINQPNYSTVYSNIHFIPEPATLLMLSLGGLLIRRKK